MGRGAARVCGHVAVLAWEVMTGRPRLLRLREGWRCRRCVVAVVGAVVVGVVAVVVVVVAAAAEDSDGWFYFNFISVIQ